jgi:hypothetical protein
MHARRIAREHDHFCSVAEKALDERVSDESRTTCDDDFHEPPFCRGAAANL